MAMRMPAGTGRTDPVEYELSRYMAPHELRHKYEDPLAFWAAVRHELPTMYKVALKLLSVPATSVLSEQTWSHAGRINEQARERLAMSSLLREIFLNRNVTEA